MRRLSRIHLFLSIFAISVAGVVAHAQECLDCHGNEDLDPLRPRLSIRADAFNQSVHGPLGCQTCHTDVRGFPHQDVHLPQCGNCHKNQEQNFEDSVHGKAVARGDNEAASCQSCHGSAHMVKAVRDVTSSVYPLNLPRTCGTCHGNADLAQRHGISVSNPYQLYMDSIHGRAISHSGLLVAANCSSCHGTHDIRTTSDRESKVSREKIPGTCGACHAGVASIYQTSTHGQKFQAGDSRAPVCIDCHTAHQISRVDTEAWKLEIVKECGSCHKQSLRTYRDTFHGQVTSLGFTVVARCSDCHGSHDILPPSDPRSSVAAGNRVKTCRKCHQQAGVSFAGFDPHADRRDKARNPGLYYTALVMNVLIVSVFAFFGLHTLLWLIRSALERRKQGGPAGD
ncbi:MAG: hypothetical protein HYX72_05050 [Acidobacteria bacterium]|nr:hypothetical protein [Acidobacteriota bacterium]